MGFDFVIDSLIAIQSVLLAISVGISIGIISGVWVKKNVKLKQEKIFDENRRRIIQTMLGQIYYSYHQMGSILAIFEKKEGFSSKKHFSSEFSDNEISYFESYGKFIQNNLKKLPKFHDCSAFIQYDEYLAIKKYILSSIFFYPIDGSRVGKKNLVGYNEKFFLDHALFAKRIIELFTDKGLNSNFIIDWKAFLEKEGMLDPNFKKKPSEPGDIVPNYLFDSELL